MKTKKNKKKNGWKIRMCTASWEETPQAWRREQKILKDVSVWKHNFSTWHQMQTLCKHLAAQRNMLEKKKKKKTRKREVMKITRTHTCEPERRHTLKLGLLQPLPHAPECLPTGLQLAPRLGVAQEVTQRSLTSTQNSLGKHGLWNAVAFQLAADLLR